MTTAFMLALTGLEVSFGKAEVLLSQGQGADG